MLRSSVYSGKKSFFHNFLLHLHQIFSYGQLKLSHVPTYLNFRPTWLKLRYSGVPFCSKGANTRPISIKFNL